MVTSNIEEHYIKTPFISFDKAKALKLKFISEFGDLSVSKPEYIAPPPPKAPRFSKEEERQFIYPNSDTATEQLNKTAKALKTPLSNELIGRIAKIQDPIKKQIAYDAAANILKRNSEMSTKPLNENETFISKFQKFVTGSDFLTTENIIKSFDASNQNEKQVQNILLSMNSELNSIKAKFGELVFVYCKNLIIVSLVLAAIKFAGIPPMLASLFLLYSFLSGVSGSKTENEAKEIIDIKKKEILNNDELENLPPGELHDYVEGLFNNNQLNKILDNIEFEKVYDAIKNTDETKNYPLQENLKYIKDKQIEVIKCSETYDWYCSMFETMAEDYERENEFKTTALSLVPNADKVMETETLNEKKDSKAIQNNAGSSFAQKPMEAPLNEIPNGTTSKFTEDLKKDSASNFIASFFTSFGNYISNLNHDSTILLMCSLIGSASYDYLVWRNRKRIGTLKNNENARKLVKLGLDRGTIIGQGDPDSSNWNRDEFFNSEDIQELLNAHPTTSTFEIPETMNIHPSTIRRLHKYNKLISNVMDQFVPVPPFKVFYFTNALAYTLATKMPDINSIVNAIGDYSVYYDYIINNFSGVNGYSFITSIAKLYFYTASNAMGNQRYNHFINSNIKLKNDVNNIHFSEINKKIIDDFNKSLDGFYERMKDDNFKRIFFNNFNDPILNMAEKCLKNSTIVEQRIISEQPLMITNIESGNIQSLETVTATDLNQEIDTKKQIQEQAKKYELEINVKYDIVEKFAKKYNMPYPNALGFLTKKYNALAANEKNKQALLALENNPNLMIYGYKNIDYNSMVDKSFEVDNPNFYDVMKSGLKTGITSKQVITQVASQAIHSLNKKMAYLGTDLKNSLNDQKNGKEFDINNYPVLKQYFHQYKTPSEINSAAIMEIKKMEKTKKDIQETLKQINDLADLFSSNLIDDGTGQKMKTPYEKVERMRGLLVVLYDLFEEAYNLPGIFDDILPNLPKSDSWWPSWQNNDDYKDVILPNDSPKKQEKDDILKAIDELSDENKQNEDSIEITGKGISKAVTREKKFHISSHKKPILNEFDSVDKIIKHISMPLTKMRPYKKFTKKNNDKLIDNVIENIPNQISPIVNPNKVGCGRCGSLNDLHVHDKNLEDITCQTCVGKGITSKRFITKDVNLQPIENSKNEKHIEILKNNDAHKAIEKLKINQNDTLWQKFKKSIPIKLNFINRYSKMSVPKKEMNDYELNKLIVLLGKYQHDYENMSKQLLLNMEHMIAEYINNSDKKSYAAIDSSKFGDFETLKKYFTSSPNSFLSILTDI